MRGASCYWEYNNDIRSNVLFRYEQKLITTEINMKMLEHYTPHRRCPGSIPIGDAIF